MNTRKAKVLATGQVIEVQDYGENFHPRWWDKEQGYDEHELVFLNDPEDYLIALADSKGITQLDEIDDLVHDIASSMASSVNNGGLREQIRFVKKEEGHTALQAIESLLQKAEKEGANLTTEEPQP